MAVYRPRWQSQFGWGTRFDSQNCTMAAGAILLDRWTLGRIVTNAPHLRTLSGVGATPDGTSMTDVERAIMKGYDIDIKNPLPFEPWEVFESKIKNSRGAIIAGDCKYVRGSAKCPAGLDKNHALFVNEMVSETEFLCYDPAEHTADAGVFTLTRKQLRNYSSNWTMRHGAPPGMVNAAYTRKTPAVAGPGPKPDPKVDTQDETLRTLTSLSSGGILGFGAAILVVGAVGVGYVIIKNGNLTKGPGAAVMEGDE